MEKRKPKAASFVILLATSSFRRAVPGYELAGWLAGWPNGKVLLRFCSPGHDVGLDSALAHLPANGASEQLSGFNNNIAGT